jgi:superfamily II DNA helicase RecQ
VVRSIKRKLREYQKGKMVVYCSSVDKVKALAAALGCEGYYHDVEDREGRLERFMTGKSRVMAAMNALGMGINIPDIRVIWHVDRPRTLLDYAQENGQFGRDRLKSEAIKVIGWGGGNYREKQEEVELVKRLLNTEGCRREVLEEYLDGLTGQVCEEGDEHCDGCERRRDTQAEMVAGERERERAALNRARTEAEAGPNRTRTEMEDRMERRRISRQLRQQER